MNKVYYQFGTERPLSFGLDFCRKSFPDIHARLLSGDLSATHKLVRELPDDMDIETVFREMQGEVWSPNGEQREYIKSLSLQHTSMYAGDIIMNDYGTWVCEWAGWSKIA